MKRATKRSINDLTANRIVLRQSLSMTVECGAMAVLANIRSEARDTVKIHHSRYLAKSLHILFAQTKHADLLHL